MNKYIKIILLILVIWWMAIVFCFSHEQSVESSATSFGFIETILNIVGGDNMDTSTKLELIQNLQSPIRTLAHFTIYFIGGVIIYFFFSTTKYTEKVKIGLSILLSFAYAVFDECHQYFVPGRVADIADVCIDTLGAFAGIMLIVFVTNMLSKRDV